MDRLLLSVLVATLLLVIFWLFFSKKHAASRRQIGNTIVICGPVGAGKTTLFLKVSYVLMLRFFLHFSYMEKSMSRLFCIQ